MILALITLAPFRVSRALRGGIKIFQLMSLGVSWKWVLTSENGHSVQDLSIHGGRSHGENIFLIAVCLQTTNTTRKWRDSLPRKKLGPDDYFDFVGKMNSWNVTMRMIWLWRTRLFESCCVLLAQLLFDRSFAIKMSSCRSGMISSVEESYS